MEEMGFIVSKGVNVKKHYVHLAPGSHSGKQTVRGREVCLQHPAGLLEKCVLLVNTVTWVSSYSHKYFCTHTPYKYVKFVLQ
jgi:hypothetical protein